MASTIILSDNGASSGSAGLKQTAGNDGVLILQTTTSGGTATNAIYVDTSQNVGLGVTPSAWASGTKGLEVGQVGNAIYGYSATNLFATQNTYFNGTNWIFASSNRASYYQQNSGLHTWSTSTASGTAGNAITWTQAMTLDVSGNLGVGTTSPVARVHARTGASSALSDSRYVVRAEGTSEAYLSAAGNDYVGVRFPNASSASQAYVDYYHGINAMLFGVANSERMRIDSSGNLLVNTTSSVSAIYAGTPKLFVNNAIAATNGSTTLQLTAASSSEGLYFNSSYFRVYNAAGTGVYLQGGTNAWAGTSDESLKENLEPIENALSKVVSLRAVIGNFIADEEKVRHPFLIAQDVQAVLPEAVGINPEGKLGLAYTEVIPLLVAAIKEQQAIIEQLQADVAALKGQA